MSMYPHEVRLNTEVTLRHGFDIQNVTIKKGQRIFMATINKNERVDGRIFLQTLLNCKDDEGRLDYEQLGEHFPNIKNLYTKVGNVKADCVRTLEDEKTPAAVKAKIERILNDWPLDAKRGRTKGYDRFDIFGDDDGGLESDDMLA